MELQDFDYVMFCDSGTGCNAQEYVIAKFLELVRMWTKLDTGMHVEQNMSDLPHQSELINVKRTTYEIPIGAWAEDS